MDAASKFAGAPPRCARAHRWARRDCCATRRIDAGRVVFRRAAPALDRGQARRSGALAASGAISTACGGFARARRTMAGASIGGCRSAALRCTRRGSVVLAGPRRWTELACRAAQLAVPSRCGCVVASIDGACRASRVSFQRREGTAPTHAVGLLFEPRRDQFERLCSVPAIGRARLPAGARTCAYASHESLERLLGVRRCSVSGLGETRSATQRGLAAGTCLDLRLSHALRARHASSRASSPR